MNTNYAKTGGLHLRLIYAISLLFNCIELIGVKRADANARPSLSIKHKKAVILCNF